MGRDRAINVAMLAAAAAIYGALFTVNRIAAEAGWPPVAFGAFQTIVAGVLLALYVRARGQRLVPTRQHVWAYLFVGSLALALPAGLLTKAASHVSPALLTLVLSFSPILTLLFAILVRLERFRMRAVIAVLLGLTGVLLIASPWSHAMSGTATGWFLIALAAPVMFALSNIGAALLRPPDTDSTTMAAGVLAGGGLVALPVALLTNSALFPAAATAGAVWALAAAVLINLCFTVLFFEIIRRAGPTFFSLFNYMAIGAGVLWSIAVFGELPPRVFWLALAIMLAGVYTAVGGKRSATLPETSGAIDSGAELVGNRRRPAAEERT